MLVRSRPPPRWGVLCWCVAPPTVGRAVLVRGPPHYRTCCFVAWPPSGCGVLCWCVAPLMVGRALMLPARRGGCAWCGGAWLGLLSCVPPGVRRRWVGVSCASGGVLAGAMRGLFCFFGVAFAALRSACSAGCDWRLGCVCGCVDCLAGVGSVLVRGLPHGGACCVGTGLPPRWGVLCWCVAPPWWGVLRSCVVPLMVGRAVLVRGPPHGGACCVGACPLCWWCVVWWCLAWVVVVCAACQPASFGLVWCCFSRRHARLVLLVRRRLCRLTVGVFGWLWSVVRLRLWLCCLPGRGWCCAGAWPPSWWGLLPWCVPPPMVGRAVLVRSPPPHGGSCCVAAPPLPCRGVLCWGMARLIMGRAAVLRGPPQGGACCAGAWPPSWWGVL